MPGKTIILITFVVVVFLITLLVSFIVVIVLLYQKKQITLKSTYERELLQSQLEMQELTLQHISREIHDSVGQQLTLAKLHLHTELDTRTNQTDVLESAINLITTAIEDLRDVSKSLSLDQIRMGGLGNAMESLVNQLKKNNHYTITLAISDDYNYMEEQKEIILFRILQEAVKNIIRHAQAKTINITLDCRKDTIDMLIQDDGKGFLPESIIGSSTNYAHAGGISNMQARSFLIGGQFSIKSGPGNGTLVHISVPLIP
jgi:two-component system NarL family sensor kinase